GQGKRTFQYVIVQYADLLRIEAIEAPHRFDARREVVFGHECPPLKRLSHSLTISAIYLTLSSKWRRLSRETVPPTTDGGAAARYGEREPLVYPQIERCLLVPKGRWKLAGGGAKPNHRKLSNRSRRAPDGAQDWHWH